MECPGCTSKKAMVEETIGPQLRRRLPKNGSTKLGPDQMMLLEFLGIKSVYCFFRKLLEASTRILK